MLLNRPAAARGLGAFALANVGGGILVPGFDANVRFGASSYDRPADAIMVFGARARADGRPSVALVDRDGTSTRATVEHVAALARDRGLRSALAVRRSYHLPRVKMAFDRAGVAAFTLPARESRAIATCRSSSCARSRRSGTTGSRRRSRRNARRAGPGRWMEPLRPDARLSGRGRPIGSMAPSVRRRQISTSQVHLEICAMRFRTTSLWVLGIVAAAAVSARADRVDVIVPLGVAANSQVAAAGDVATVGFLVTQGTGRKLAFTVKPGTKTSKIVPDVKVIAPDGSTFDLAANGGAVSAAGAKTWTAKLPNVPQSGLWRLEVRGASGSSGAFSALVKGTDTIKLANSKSLPPTVPVNGKVDVPITAGENTTLTVTAKKATGSSVLLTLTVLDVNGNAVSAPVSAVAKTGALSVKAMRLPTFGNYVLRFTGGSTGGSFSYAISTAAAKIKGAIPTASADPADAEPLLTATLSGHGQASSGGALSYRWVQVSPLVSSSLVSMTNPDAAATSFKAPGVAASLAFQLSVAENGILAKPVTVAVEVAKRPIADAGRSQSVAASANVTLDGSASFDRRGAGLRFSWRQIPGDATSVTLSGAATATPSFAAPNTPAVLHFGLTADDGVARSFEDVVVVNVADATKSVADAGRDQYVPRMASVYLSGLATVTPSGVLDAPMLWTQTSGPSVTLAGASSPWPSFTAPKTAGDITFKLTVDGDSTTADSVTVHVRENETNLPAPARGDGPLNAASGAITLKSDLAGNGTVDPNGDALAIRWAQISGAALTLSSSTAKEPTITLPAGDAQYVFALQANDGLQYGAPDALPVRNTGFNLLPIANAGSDRATASGVPTTIDGRASTRTDGGTAPLTYQWTQLSGKDWFDFAASSAAFNPTAAQATVTLPPDVSSLTATRHVVFQLVVNDGANSSAPDLVTVTFTGLPLNGKPVVTAQASDANPIAGELVTLQGTAFDRDGDPMTFLWTQKQGPTVTLNPNPFVLSPSFVAPSTGTPLRFEVFANDGIEDGPVFSVTVTVDQPPVANVVVTPTSGPPGTVVTMDGAAASNPSVDPEGAKLTYTWRQISGTSVSFNSNASTIAFSAPTGVVSFGLTVNDGRQNSLEKTAGFSSNLPPAVSPTASNLDTSVNPQVTGVAGFAAYGSTISLAANGSGGSGPLSYTWRVVSQSPTSPTMTTVTFSSTSSATPTILVPAPTTAAFGQTPQVTIGVTATDGTQTSSEVQMTIRFFASFNNGTSSTTTATVYAIISSNCTSCHAGTSNSCPIGSGSTYPMNSPTLFLNNSRGVSACSASATRLPSTGSTGQTSSSSAYLLGRLKNSPGPIMPQGGSLAASLINLIQDWIDQGVRTN